MNFNKKYEQLSPTFMDGYSYPQRYVNLGQLSTPYIGKRYGIGGDYGPPQATMYYTDYNRNYPYPMDPGCNFCTKNFSSSNN